METLNEETTEKFVFMLPHLLEVGLFEDDGQNYALVSYPREVISQSAKIIVGDYAKRLSTISLSNKKRVKCLIENLAVALSLPIDQNQYMFTAQTIFRRWFEDSQIFGDLARQNKFLRRLFKIISLPFAMRQPNNPEIFKTKFYKLLSDILDDFKFVHTKRGNIFEKDTWYTLLKVLIGICDIVIDFNFENLLPVSDASKLRQKAVSNCLSVILLSGLSDKNVWEQLTKFCNKWCKCIDFLKVWGHHIETLFTILNMRIFHEEINTELFVEGIYSAENKISDEMIKFIFIHFLHFADAKMTLNGSDTLREFSQTMLKITNNALGFAFGNALFEAKYPSESFLKLFGQYLTFVPINAKADDEAVSILVEAILIIISRFNIDHDSNTALKMIAYASQKAVPSSMPVVASYLKNSAQLYRYDSKALPYVSMRALDLLPQLDTTRSARMVIGETFLNSLASLFISSAETLKKYPDYHTNTINSFETIWGTTALMPIRYQLLCSSYSLNIPVIDKLLYIFSDVALCQMTQDSTSIPFLSSCIMFLGTLIRFNPSISNELIEKHLFMNILKSVPTIDYKHLDEYDYIITSVLQLIVNCLNSSPNIMQHRENINSLFEFLHIINEQINKQKRNSTTWIDKHLNIIIPLYDQIIETIPFIFPNKDYFSRVYNSCLNINEEYIIHKYQIQNPLITYFMIGRRSLASFIESKDHNSPMILLIRRSSGKIIYRVKDDYLGHLNIAQLSTELNPIQLPELDKTLPEIPEDQLFTIDLIDELPIHRYDDDLIKIYEPEFNSWLNWDKYGMYSSYKPIKPHRPQVFDFITTLNIFNNINIIENNSFLKQTLKEVDEVDKINLIPIVITTFFSNDKGVEPCKLQNEKEITSKRMTLNLSKFLKSFGECLSIKDNESDILPPLNTSVPMIPSLNSVIILLTPSMSKNENDAKKIYKIGEKSPIKIIFNESGFDLKKLLPKKKVKQLLLVIKPMKSGLYHITKMSEPRWLFSPFADEQTMSVEALEFYLAICLEQYVREDPTKTFGNASLRRRELLSDLLKDENKVNAFFGAIAKESNE
ncbi:hypothetical protein GPJ56_007318 [Histomonas meleagridis]|uniref:uncharacterized protein n=1 Tax=Histomonas meleagridis TaxID=135588 RepID=UPI00355A6CB7|nr:hypothetical protein GPJ56_007318 [Histomonas meleagridis]KAH0804164.1 hypothetical protein GO595_002994 [Histomonas meleagridis]